MVIARGRGHVILLHHNHAHIISRIGKQKRTDYTNTSRKIGKLVFLALTIPKQITQLLMK